MMLQKQLAQLELKFSGPLIKDSQVNELNDLLLLDTTYNYQHKIVWVKSEQSNYFLVSGNGSILNNWQKISSKATILPYNINEGYSIGDVCTLNGSLYIATQNVPVEYIPTSYLDYWQKIQAESYTVRYIFQDVSNVIFYTTIKNPIVSVYLGDISNPIEYDSDGNILFENIQQCDVPVVRRYDLPDSEGRAYQLLFNENEGLVNQVSGFFNIK